jgi:hypothetical protein
MAREVAWVVLGADVLLVIPGGGGGPVVVVVAGRGEGEVGEEDENGRVGACFLFSSIGLTRTVS